ncbi:hypothetical protein PRZ48_006190 [Zasmidium cellare]|uniref:Isochorismatase-like domain-containing protein n=1 Tax=Zasmidium cellare TaxID=395010 RepID=A0ABR0EMF5_ZASCE|nr:hypothetical protein PRZ48_006190 [Zasmidium cellare]
MTSNGEKKNYHAIIGNTTNFWLYSSTTGFDLTHPPNPSSPPITPRVKIQTTTKPITIDPAKSALIIIDMQNYFLHPAFGRTKGAGHAALEQLVENAIPGCRKAGIRVVWVNWGLSEEEVESMPPGAKRANGFEVFEVGGGEGVGADRMGEPYPHGDSAVENGGKTDVFRGYGRDLGRVRDPGTGEEVDAGAMLVRGAWNSDLYPPLNNIYEEGTRLESNPDVWIHKNRMSALWGVGTDLEKFLESEGIKTLFFAGVNTDQCVSGTLTDAFSKGYDCILLSDGSGTTSPDAGKGIEWNAGNTWGFSVTCPQRTSIMSPPSAPQTIIDLTESDGERAGSSPPPASPPPGRAPKREAPATDDDEARPHKISRPSQPSPSPADQPASTAAGGIATNQAAEMPAAPKRISALQAMKERAPRFLTTYSTELGVEFKNPDKFCIKPPFYRRWQPQDYINLAEFMRYQFDPIPFARAADKPVEEINLIASRLIFNPLYNASEAMKRGQEGLDEVLAAFKEGGTISRSWGHDKNIKGELDGVKTGGEIRLVCDDGSLDYLKIDQLDPTDTKYLDNTLSQRDWTIFFGKSEEAYDEMMGKKAVKNNNKKTNGDGKKIDDPKKNGDPKQNTDSKQSDTPKKSDTEKSDPKKNTNSEPNDAAQSDDSEKNDKAKKAEAKRARPEKRKNSGPSDDEDDDDDEMPTKKRKRSI